MIVRRSALVGRSATVLFDLIEAAEHYPRFLPWCARAHIVSRDDTVVSADLTVRWLGLDFEMRTRNPKQRPEYMAIHLERGPFRRFEGEWRLAPLSPDACKVTFVLDYEFDSNLTTLVAGPVFSRITDKLVDAFVRQAMVMPEQPPNELAGPAVEASERATQQEPIDSGQAAPDRRPPE
ncbi:MAG: type II toxin-antitoxin system RatA family toxin [Rubrivivax sp.]